MSHAPIPNELRYAKSHEWLKAASDGTATVGITEHAQSSLGDITYVQLPKIGTTLKAGEPFGVVESVKAASDVYAPLSGEVVEINAALEDQPELINTEAFEGGWLIKLRASNPEEWDALLTPEAYAALLEQEA